MVDVQRSRPRVLVRLLALASTVLALGAGGHTAVADALPDPRAALALAALTVVAALPLARHRLQVRTLAPAVALWQWLVHAALAAAAPPTAPHPVAHRHVHGGAPPAAPTGDDASAAVMVTAHAAATLLTVALLVAAERGVDRALDRLAWALPVLVDGHAPLVVGTRRVPGAAATVRVLRAMQTCGAHGSRAPPVSAVVA